MWRYLKVLTVLPTAGLVDGGGHGDRGDGGGRVVFRLLFLNARHRWNV